jgi:predicted RNase H-like HicB family nuclease
VRIVLPHPVLRLGLTIKVDREYGTGDFIVYVEEFGGIATNAKSGREALDQTADMILVEFECYRKIRRRLPLTAVSAIVPIGPKGFIRASYITYYTQHSNRTVDLDMANSHDRGNTFPVNRIARVTR